MSAVRIRPRTPSWASSSVGRTPASQAGGHGFESRPVHHRARRACANGELTELADGARLLSEYGAQVPSGVRIPDSPPFCACHAIWRGGRADDCGGSENRLSLRGHEGSNPSLSSRARGAAVAQGTHNPWVAGSNPAGHQCKASRERAVGAIGSAPALQAGGCEFEPRTVHQHAARRTTHA